MNMLELLINRLQQVGPSVVAKEAGVSRKTVVRIRDGKHEPNFGTASKVVAALDRMKVKVKKRAPEEQAEAGQEAV